MMQPRPLTHPHTAGARRFAAVAAFASSCRPLPGSPLAWVAAHGGWAMVATLLLALAHGWWYYVSIIDDPFIMYRYAQNLVEGQGMVFTPGERVEAYSNFLWTLAMAGLVVLNLAPETFNPALGFLAGLALVFFMASRVTAAWAGPFRGRLGALLVALSPAWAFWAPGGLETPVFVLALFWGMWRGGEALRATQQDAATVAWRDAWVGLTLAALLRIEGAAFSLILAGWAAWTFRQAIASPAQSLGSQPALRACLGFMLASALVQGGHHLWRLWYFGALLPNSFTAKATGHPALQWWEGAQYLTRGLMLDMLPTTVLCLAGAAAWALWRGRLAQHPLPLATPHAGLFITVVMFQCVFMVLVGGDWMPFSRFHLPLLPFLAMLAQDSCQLLHRLCVQAQSYSRRDALACMVMVLIIAGLAAEYVQGRLLMRVVREHRLVEPVIGMSMTMAAAMPAEASLTAEEAGYLPFYTRMPFYDMLGLLTPEVARMPGMIHRKVNAPWILDQRPDLAVLIVVPERDAFHHPLHGALPGSAAMLLEPRFHADYELLYVQPRGSHLYGHANMLVYARRRDMAANLPPLGLPITWSSEIERLKSVARTGLDQPH